jgi:gas vesicle protein
MSRAQTDGTDTARTDLVDESATLGSETVKEDTGVERRGLIKGAVLGAASAIGIAPAAGAELSDVERQQAVEEFRDEAAIRAAFAEHEDLLAELVDDGFLPSTDLADFDFDLADSLDAGSRVVKPTAKTLSGEVVPTLELSYRAGPDSASVRVAVFPEHDHAFAAVYGAVDAQTYGDPLTLDHGTSRLNPLSASTSDCYYTQCAYCNCGIFRGDCEDGCQCSCCFGCTCKEYCGFCTVCN